MKPKVTPTQSLNGKYTPEPYSGCWLWTGCVTGAGYGRIKTGRFRMDAHRASYLLHRGEIPVGMFVLHKCDTKLCINPNHLFLGTALDNMRDCVKKGRSASGERHGMSKLSWIDVEAIRSSPGNQYQIAAAFKISQSQVSLIKRGKSWGQPISEMT